MADDVAAPFGMFLRPTGKGHAQRYGDRRPMGYAGRDEEGRVIIDTGVVIAMSHEEAQRLRREYRRQIREGCCVEVDAAAYRAFVKASHEAEAKALRDAEAAGKQSTAAAGTPETGTTKKRTGGRKPSKTEE